LILLGKSLAKELLKKASQQFEPVPASIFGSLGNL
jgi:hypothetical protein